MALEPESGGVVSSIENFNVFTQPFLQDRPILGVSAVLTLMKWFSYQKKSKFTSKSFVRFPLCRLTKK
jgi:hypothetical protein